MGLLQCPVIACLSVSIGRGAWIAILNVGDVVSNGNVIFNRSPLADEGVTRYLAVPANLRATLYFDKRSDTCVIADLTAIQVDEIAQDHTRSQFHVIGNTLELNLCHSVCPPMIGLRLSAAPAHL